MTVSHHHDDSGAGLSPSVTWQSHIIIIMVVPDYQHQWHDSLTPSRLQWCRTISVSDIHTLTVTNISPNIWCHHYDRIGKNIHTIQTVTKIPLLPFIKTANGRLRWRHAGKFIWFHTVPFSSDYACALFFWRSLTSTCQFLWQVIHFWPRAAPYLVIPDILTVVLLKMQVSQDVTISSWTTCHQRWRHYDPPSPQELFSSQHVLTTHKTLYTHSLKEPGTERVNTDLTFTL